MKYIKRPLIFVLLIILSLSCNNEKDVIITGTYPGNAHDYLFVNMADLKNPAFIDSVRISRTGKFKIKIDAGEPSFYTLGFDNNEFITVVAEPGDRISLDFNDGLLQNGYKVTGSEESEKIRKLDKKLGQTLFILDSLSSEYQKINGDESLTEKASALEELYVNKLEEQRKHNIGFILNNLSKLSAVKALYQQIDENTYVLYEQRDLQYLKLVSDSLNSYYPGISLTKTLAENVEKELNQMYINRISNAAEGAASTELDASLKDINGERIKLSGLMEDNYVLLSFWSAESKECISNNLFLKQMYSLYHNRGFEIYQVSLDNDEALWRRSVRFDELPWISVREDDPSRPVTASLFNISSVPSNYLFNMDGEIIGKNLTGRALKIKLGQLFD